MSGSPAPLKQKAKKSKTLNAANLLRATFGEGNVYPSSQAVFLIQIAPCTQPQIVIWE